MEDFTVTNCGEEVFPYYTKRNLQVAKVNKKTLKNILSDTVFSVFKATTTKVILEALYSFLKHHLEVTTC